MKKTLDLRTDASELAESLRVLSTFYGGENSAEQRRLLRANIERRGLKINEAFLAASDNAQQALTAAEAQLDQLSACCERITLALEASRASTARPTLHRATPNDAKPFCLVLFSLCSISAEIAQCGPQAGLAAETESLGRQLGRADRRAALVRHAAPARSFIVVHLLLAPWRLA